MTISQNEIESIKKFIGKNSLSAKICAGGFRNFTGSVSLPEALVIDIETTTVLAAILSRVNEDNQKKSNERIVLRVAAGGRSDIRHSESWSMSPCCAADIIIRLTGKEFCQLEVLDNNMVRAGASLQIGETDRRLYNEYGLTLSTSPLLEGATLAGFMCNGGHGNGKEQPAFTGLVHAISLCLPNGEMRRIDSSHPDFETIRGAPMGLFGIITELEIATIPAKKMERTDKKRSIPELYEEIRDGQLFEKNDYVSILFIPNTKKNEEIVSDKKMFLSIAGIL